MSRYGFKISRYRRHWLPKHRPCKTKCRPGLSLGKLDSRTSSSAYLLNLLSLGTQSSFVSILQTSPRFVKCEWSRRCLWNLCFRCPSVDLNYLYLSLSDYALIVADQSWNICWICRNLVTNRLELMIDPKLFASWRSLTCHHCWTMILYYLSLHSCKRKLNLNYCKFVQMKSLAVPFLTNNLYLP